MSENLNESFMGIGLSVVPDLSVDGEEESWKHSFYEPLPNWVHNLIGSILMILIYLGVHGNGITIHIFLS